MSKRQYSDSDKAVALATLDANGGNVEKTAKTLKMPRKTLEDWSKGRKQHPDVAEMRHIKKGELSTKLEEVAWALTENLSVRAESDLSILVPMKDIATSLGIVIDKMQLLKGEPTGITQHQVLTEDERQKVKAQIRDKGKIPEVSQANN